MLPSCAAIVKADEQDKEAGAKQQQDVEETSADGEAELSSDRHAQQQQRFPHKLAELQEADKLEMEAQPRREATASTMSRVLGRRASHTVWGHGLGVRSEQ